MGRTGETLSDILAQAATLLGLKPSEARKLELIQEKLRVEKTRYQDKVSDLKDEVKRLESIAMRKKREMDDARGQTKRLVAREIEQVLRERNGLQEKVALWFSRLEKVTLLLRKLELAGEIESAEKVDLEELADIASERMEELIDIEKRADRATEDLEGLTYEEPARQQMDIAAELGETEDPSDAPPLLSEQAMKDLADLEEPESE